MNNKEVTDAAKKIKDVSLRFSTLGMVRIIVVLGGVVAFLWNSDNNTHNKLIAEQAREILECKREQEETDLRHRIEIAGKDSIINAKEEGKEKIYKYVDSLQISRINEYKNKLK